jgi:hypothetical protein
MLLYFRKNQCMNRIVVFFVVSGRSNYVEALPHKAEKPLLEPVSTTTVSQVASEEVRSSKENPHSYWLCGFFIVCEGFNKFA